MKFLLCRKEAESAWLEKSFEKIASEREIIFFLGLEEQLY